MALVINDAAGGGEITNAGAPSLYTFERRLLRHGASGTIYEDTPEAMERAVTAGHSGLVLLGTPGKRVPIAKAVEWGLVLDDDADQAPAAPEEGTAAVALAGLSRAELNAAAEQEGVPDAEKLPNKQAVIDAIEAARAEQDEERAEQDEEAEDEAGAEADQAEDEQDEG